MHKTQRRRAAGQPYDQNELLRKSKLRTDEAAFLLDVAPRTVERYMEQGKIQFIRTPGGHRRALTESVKRYL
jgi:excisionase family DNA binding protein